jgi:hypothetical protein
MVRSLFFLGSTYIQLYFILGTECIQLYLILGTEYIQLYFTEQHFSLLCSGDMSLKHCFEYFDDDMVSKVHKRFFRRLDLSDKVIDRAINNVNNEDCVYELLGVWLEREGQEAKLHHLLQKLRDLDQNRTADSIVEKAIANGHYERGGISHPSYSGKSDE